MALETLVLDQSARKVPLALLRAGILLSGTVGSGLKRASSSAGGDGMDHRRRRKDREEEKGEGFSHGGNGYDEGAKPATVNGVHWHRDCMPF